VPLPRALEALFLDDAGALLLKTEIGIGVLLDRDLSTVLERLTDGRGRPVDLLLRRSRVGRSASDAAGQKPAISCNSFRGCFPAGSDLSPAAPRAGEPEC